MTALLYLAILKHNNYFNVEKIRLHLMVGKRSGSMDLSTKKIWIPGTQGMQGEQRVVHQLKSKGNKSALRGRGADNSRGDRSTDSRFDEGKSLDCRDYDSRPDMNKMDRAVSVLERKSRDLSTPIKRSFTAPSRPSDREAVPGLDDSELDATSLRKSEMRRNVEAHLRDDIEEAAVAHEKDEEDTCDADSEMEVGFESVITVSEASITDPMVPCKELEKSIAMSESEKTDTTYKSEDSKIEEKKRIKPMTQMERDVSEFERKAGPLTTPVGRTPSTPVKRSSVISIKRASVSVSEVEDENEGEEEGDSDGEIGSIEGVAMTDEERPAVDNTGISNVTVDVKVDIEFEDGDGDEAELHIIDVPVTLPSEELDDVSDAIRRREEEEDESDLSNDGNDNLIPSNSAGHESMQEEGSNMMEASLTVTKEHIQAHTVECDNTERDLGSADFRILHSALCFSMELFCAEYVHCLVMSVVSRVAHAGKVMLCEMKSLTVRTKDFSLLLSYCSPSHTIHRSPFTPLSSSLTLTRYLM